MSYNARAEASNKLPDQEDWGLRNWVFVFLKKAWGQHDIDWFVLTYKISCGGIAGINALDQNWSNVSNWWLPPPTLIALAVQKIIKVTAKGTLVVPEWGSAV